MIQGVDRCDASIQHNAQYGLGTCSNNIQPPIMKPPDQSKYQDYTGQHNDSQCPVADCRLMHTNNMLQVTPTPNNAHADTPTPFSTKISEKITLPLPYYQSHHYTHTAINKKTMGTLESTTTAHQQHSHPYTPNNATQQTNPPTNIIASATSPPLGIASTTVMHKERLIRQKSSPSNSDLSPKHTP